MNINRVDHVSAAEEKLKYVQAQQANCGQSVRGIGDTYQNCSDPRRPSLREEAEENVRIHAEQLEKQSRAAAFFGEHPEFDEFAQLIRSGVICIY